MINEGLHNFWIISINIEFNSSNNNNNNNNSNNNNNLFMQQQHKRIIHRNEMPFQCDIYTKQFTTVRV